MIGVLHRIASEMYNRYSLQGGVFGQNFEKSKEHGEALNLDPNRIYPDLETLIEEEIKKPEAERMEAISVLTPNVLHYSMVKRLLESGFHVICEKPFTTTLEEAEELFRLQALSDRVLALTYTYTGYPMIRQMRNMILSGRLGKVQKVDAQYFQGWINPIIHDAEKRKETWRLDPEKSGPSCCIGDIGTHAFQMLEFVSGLKVEKLLADLNYLYPENVMDVDGAVLLRLEGEIKGCLRASQIATGEENAFEVKIYGTKAGLVWRQENPNELFFLEEGKPLQVFKPGNAYNDEFSLMSSKLPPGHPEGIFDAMGNIYHGAAKAIRKEEYDSGEFPDQTDGLRGIKFVKTVLDSHREGNVWKALK